MKLLFLAPNQAWVATFGEQLVDLGGQLLFETREEAVKAAQRLGLIVEKDGTIHAADPVELRA